MFHRRDAVRFRRVCDERGQERRYAIAALALGAIKRTVAVNQHLAQVVSGFDRRGYAKTCGYVEVDSRFRAGQTRNRNPQQFRALQGRIETAVRQQDAELLTAQSPEDVVCAHVYLEHGDGALQHDVAGDVAVRVVDGLEVVEVDQDDAGLARRLAAVLQYRLRLVHEMLAIEYSGQAVAPREFLETHLRKLGAIRPPDNESEHDSEQQQIEALRFFGLFRDLLLQLQDLIRFGQCLYLVLLVHDLLIDDLIRQC